MEVYGEDKTIISDSDYVLKKWKNEFEKLYQVDEFSTYDQEFYDYAVYNLKCREDIINDPAYISESDFNVNFSRTEISKIVINTKKGKSAGTDGLPYEIFKNDKMISVLHGLRHVKGITAL